MRVLLDTNLLILEPDFSRLDEEPEAFVTAALCYAELAEGEFSPDPVLAAQAIVQYATARELLGEGLPFDQRAATLYRAVCQASKARGRGIGRARRIDLMIAAVALAHDCALATRNPADFAGVDQVVRVLAL